jgi:two-component system, cell cycle sensor histidine kinase and response regulator CckA
MAWPQLDNVDALVRSARHNARFGGVRLPLIIIVSVFLWQLIAPTVAIAWIVAMIIVERTSTYARGRLIAGEAQLAALHLFTLCMMSALWVCFGVLLWVSDTEIGRIAAIIGLLTTSLYGALGGQKDLRPSLIITVPPLLSLCILVSLHAWTHWPLWNALISSLATFGAGVSVLVCAWALNRSDATLHRANSELEQVAAKLARNTALLEEMSSLAHVGGWRLDLIGQHLEWTAQTRHIHDVEDGFEPTLETALSFYLPESRKRIERAIEVAVQTGEGWDLELQVMSARGVVKWVRANGKVIQGSGGATGLVGAFADISARVQMEAELRQSQKLESIGRLTGGIAHDFNNVLTAIVNSADLLHSAGNDDERRATLVAIILKAAERATGLTRNLLAFSRQQVLTPKPTDLNTAITEAAELLAALIPSDICVVVECHNDEVLALLDPTQLCSALVNLAVNARDAMPRGGTLRLRTTIRNEVDADFAVIIVADTGAGIDPAVAASIFDPFFTTKGGDGGTGLGLAMVHGFVTQSGGSISVDSALGIGTTFALSFPLLAERQDIAASRSEEPVAPQPLAGARILLVDDDELVRDALTISLCDEGYSVVTAADGPHALQLFEDGTEFDLVVADVVLTAAMSGPLLAQMLLERNPSLKTVLVSGYTRDKLTETGRLPAGVSFLQKPFSMETLASLMAELKIGSPQGDFGF